MSAFLVSFVAVGLSLTGPSGAHAGGTQVVVAAVAGDVWVTTGFDVVKVDAATGRVLRRSEARYPYLVGLGAGDGNIWVSSVEDGFVSGAVTRIPDGAGRVTQPLVLPSQPVLALAVGSGTTWALVGPWSALRLAAIDQATGKATLKPIRDVGWIAADDTGGTPGLFGVSMRGKAVRISREDTVGWTADTERIESPAVVGLGSVWVAGHDTLYRLDAATGRVQGTTPVNGAEDLALGGGHLWAVSVRRAGTGLRYALLEIDPRTMRIVKQAPLDGPVGNISVGNGALWMGRDFGRVDLLRVDPVTLQERVFARDLDTTQP